MNKRKSKYGFGKIKRGNLKLFGAFLGAAFLFLLLTKLSQDYTEEVSLNVELSNLEDELVIVNDSLPKVKVMVKSKGFSLLKYMFNDSETITIDVQSEMFKKNKSLFWDAKNKKYKLNTLLGKSVEILDIKPDTIEFKYDMLASKKVPVVLNKKVVFSDGFDIVNNFKLSQDSIKVIGSKQIIDTIDSVETKLFQLENINKDISKSITLVSVKDVEFMPKNLYLEAKVRRFTEGEFTLPVELINIPTGKIVNIFPKEVDLIFYVDIENFKNVKPEDFRLVSDFNDVKNDSQSTLNIQIAKKSDLVKRTRLLQNNLEFIIAN
ncbi:MAG: YbbR-like domain-containing protein [Winogradskyella sp.]|uniref:YbbR-like domain-containing protein n=1 Tax=Winogradskyella sp. TaxID=1883156 RepID=UPI0017E6E813|nr:YbbR-like domain-containing protein [Winogradskyella sp.]MBT8245846.1 YbbR-like domain-containing protein [Winogradskyella sp.]NNK22617.1 YbbR-like domain-containing protein [Winogradskyella sp.]